MQLSLFEVINEESSVSSIENENLSVNSIVKVEYGGQYYTGVVKSIYNNGQTINVIFDGKHSAFYYEKM